MNPCTYQITRYSFTPSKEVVTLEERKKKFQDKLKNWARYNDVDKKEYPDWLRKDFFIYWTEFANDNGRKMRFEMEKTWNTGRRLATAKRTIYSKDPRWKTIKPEGFKLRQTQGNYGEIDYEKAKQNAQRENKITTAGQRIKDSLYANQPSNIRS